MNDCPNCEYHRKRAQFWRDEAYRQAGHPLPEREWVGLTDQEMLECLKSVDVATAVNLLMSQYEMPPTFKVYAEAIEAKLKEKNEQTKDT